MPRYRVNADCTLGPRNDVALVSLLHKMGYRGTTSTILSFGEDESCVAHLIGERHQGLAYMFQMMNEARIGVGLGAAALGHAGYRYAAHYARERRQGRPLSGRDPTQPPVPIIAHPDVRRMLLAQRAWSEGGMALCLYAARLVDDERTASDEATRRDATLLLDLLTPICKAWPSIYGPRANDLAIQVLGGYGYTRDYPVKQYYRDNRLNPIHEGTNGIQGLDLLGRKVGAGDGEGFRRLGLRVAATIVEACAQLVLAGLGEQLKLAWSRLDATTSHVGDVVARGKRDEALADASLYLEAFGHVVVAWLWLEQALRAERLLELGAADADFLRGKRQACRYFFAYELPQVATWCDTIERMDGICLATAPEWF